MVRNIINKNKGNTLIIDCVAFYLFFVLLQAVILVFELLIYLPPLIFEDLYDILNQKVLGTPLPQIHKGDLFWN